jgi:succinate dehydrogenase/fumarate reductase cytochrome b subunit
MPRRNLNYYLIKTVRLTGWLLFALMVLYILSGFSLTGELELVDERIALIIHKVFEWPLIVVFAVHSLITIYFALRRWGWIKRRTRA